MKGISTDSEVRKFVLFLVKNYGAVCVKGGKHVKLFPPNSEKYITIPSTPSKDTRVFKNFRSCATRVFSDAGIQIRK